MISSNESRAGYIGGSDMGMVYGSYETKTFKDWWLQKKTGLKISQFQNIYTICGNIVEDYILNEVGVDYPSRHKKVTKLGTIAGVNTDALEEVGVDNKLIILHEAKTMKSEKVDKIIFGYAIPANYRRQVYHGMWCADADKGFIHILPMEENDYENPFAVNTEMVVTRELSLSDFDTDEHEIRIGYLTYCMEEGVDPSNDGLEFYRTDRNH